MAYQPNKAIHPGHTIARALEREGMTQKNLSERTGLTEKHLSQIINGEASITVETALLFENALGGTASFWINLEKNFQETKARIEKFSSLRAETALLSRFPYLELAKRKYVEQTNIREKRVEELWKFFGVNSLSFVANTEAVAFRKRTVAGVRSEGIAAWLRCGEIESKKVTIEKFSEAALKDSLKSLRALTTKTADKFSVEAQQILGNAGVSLVYIPHFTETGVSGAVRWIGDTPVIQLSLFGAYADMFWFNLFHEIGHILLHGKKERFLEFDERPLSDSQEKEIEADNFATRELIDHKSYSDFLCAGDFSKRAILGFAKSIKLDPGIIAGRLSHDRLVGWRDVASLRTRLKFS